MGKGEFFAHISQVGTDILGRFRELSFVDVFPLPYNAFFFILLLFLYFDLIRLDVFDLLFDAVELQVKFLELSFILSFHPIFFDLFLNFQFFYRLLE